MINLSKLDKERIESKLKVYTSATPRRTAQAMSEHFDDVLYKHHGGSF